MIIEALYLLHNNISQIMSQAMATAREMDFPTEFEN